MRHFLILILSASFFLSCNTKKEDSVEKCDTEVTTTEEGFEMYQMSEMAALMEQMYEENMLLKERILKGDTIGKFPQHFTKIHEAVLTDETDKDCFFKAQAASFIQAQELIYKDPENAKEHFNKGIDACIQCHQVKCGGPIPKIKKLYISK